MSPREADARKKSPVSQDAMIWINWHELEYDLKGCFLKAAGTF
jgi:hypothetical protein